MSGAPVESSAQNALAGRVVAVRPVGRGLESVAVDCGVVIQAVVTDFSIQTMGLVPGREVWITFKVSAVRLY